ncbi:Acyl transferase domain-containing protein [Enhydrobacter aerosaccus]|uniref:Acyl transferase domain-containing protein n=2 Tax=Enhydrobacter aerosaccus TaxID=225324 RepID=A0A1T4SCQ4_9HYPH|nr:Acyl transferase domain-containing protein [Enhydrobacter aerosaccus]
MPGARDNERLWQLLKNNKCSVTWVTPDRFSTEGYYHPATDRAGRTYTFAAGVIDDAWGFDATAFGMSPREAEQVDPQHRHLLEVTYDAIAHSGVRPSTLSGSDTGVYIGASSVDHGTRFLADPAVVDVHMMTGNALSIMANRISYSLDLRGPSFAIDTACSSSLVALHLAADAIRNGTIDTAIVGGVNMILSPLSFVGFSRASMLSPTGLCRPFDSAADGYVRAEGVAVFVLRSMAAAHKARNRIRAVIVGTGINQDGRTTGLSLPSAKSQQALLDRVYSDFSVDPADLLFVEAHGTGTRVGDPLEAHALGSALAQRRAQTLPIGSIKSNIGHLEPVSGLAGLLKTVMALEHGVVPATLHQKSPNPDIMFDELNLRVIDRNLHLGDHQGDALAGVNSFGFGGTNAHAIVRADKSVERLVQLPPHWVPPLILSAHSSEALTALAARYFDQWPATMRSALEFIGASAFSRDMLPHRALFLGASTEEIRRGVGEFAEGNEPASAIVGQSLGSDLPVAFVFAGNGSQWAGMGRTAWETNENFRDALREVEEHFAKVQTWSIIDTLFAADLPEKLRQASYSQPLLLALQVATVRALESMGVTPSATVGHSVGEISAAWAAGALSLKDAIDVVVARSRHQESARGAGGMAAVMLSEREAKRFLSSILGISVDIAAVNSWRNVTISGRHEDLDKVLAAANKARISARRLDLDYPYHSPLVNSVRAPLLRELSKVRSLPPRRKFFSTVTGAAIETEALGAEHWWRNVRDPVQFYAAINAMVKEDFRVFVEISPRTVLANSVRDVLREKGIRGAVIDTLREKEVVENGASLRAAAARVVVSGGTVNLHRFFGQPPASSIDLPLYPWQHTQLKIGQSKSGNTFLDPPSHPLLGRRPRQDSMEWFSTIDSQLYPWLEDHKVGDISVMPAAAYVEMALAAGREVFGDGPLELRDFDILQPLQFDGRTMHESQVRLSPETGLIELLFRQRDEISEWALHARGVVGISPVVGKKKSLPSPGPVIVLKSKVYEVSRSLGLGYGPAFQRLEKVSFPQPKLALSSVTPVLPLPPAPYVTDLTAFDASFHALFAAEEAGVADMPMKRYLPVRLGCVRVYKPNAVIATIVARTLRQSPTSLLVDIELYDEGDTLVLSAELVRLVEAQSEAGANPQALSYHVSEWVHDRPGTTSLLVPTPFATADTAATASFDEANLLLNAGCLRAAWKALSMQSSSEQLDDALQPDWLPFLRSSLFWHLESRGLAGEQEGRRIFAASCELPEISSIVKSLTVRHPSMIAEITGLARIDEVLHGIISGERNGAADFASNHWRHLSASSPQVQLLRQAVVGRLSEMMAAMDADRLVRGLMIGAEHIEVACTLMSRFSNLELIVTDADDSRIEEAGIALSDAFPRIRCMSWSSIGEIPAQSLDFCGAVDGLSEAAAMPDALQTLHRLLRPGAPLLAGELSPSLFWDIARSTRRSWWHRSASAEFPVGALLTSQEWTQELESAGFRSIVVLSADKESAFGTLLAAVAGRLAPGLPATNDNAPVFSWEGPANDGGLLTSLRKQVAGSLPHTPAVTSTAEAAPSVTDIVWAVDRIDGGSSELAAELLAIAERLRFSDTTPARFWVVIPFENAGELPSHRPQWCSLAAAMRVARNENAGLEIRCLGVAGETSDVFEALAAELMSPDAEHDVFIEPARRTIFRLERGVAEQASDACHQPDTTVVLESGKGFARQKLVWASAPRPVLGADQVEIEVKAVGLNFRDVMWNLRMLPEEALEDGFSGPGLGMECSGVVSRVGAEVSQFKPGDRVVGFTRQAFCGHVVTPELTVVRLPENLSFEAASGIPVAFLTAYYSLIHLAKLTAKETVLIHGGAGAVGLAAIQIARRLGARTIVSAGSEEKRALLRNLGVDFVCNSRTLAFADEVREFTGGKGVDVVLNSLAGEAMIRSVDCLRPFGRFVELGKRDFYSNTHLGLRPMRRNLTYFGVDVDQLIGEHRHLARQLFVEVLNLFRSEDLSPIPYRVFDGEFVNDAFHLMQRSGHIGKVVVTPPTSAATASRAGAHFPVDGLGTHVVLGGTRGFGLATAEWLVARGARNIVLASRSADLTDSGLAKVEAMRLRGVTVSVESVDVTSKKSLAILFHRCAVTGPIKGIVLAAMALDDRLMVNHDRVSIATALEPKVDGVMNLEAIAQDLKLDYLLLYSSFTTMFGNPGQYNYVAANAFMEGMARRMQAQNIPAVAVAWGAIEDVGFLARNMVTDAHLKKRFSSSLITSQMALDALDWLCDDNGRFITANCGIARMDWAAARRDLVTLRLPMFTAIAMASSGHQSEETAALIQRLKSLPIDEATDAVVEIVVVEIARVLRLPPKEIDRHRPLAEIGMDSLMMLELRTTVEATLQIELPMMSLSSGITPVDVAHRIALLVAGAEQQAFSGTIAAIASSHFTSDAEGSTSAEQQAAVNAMFGKVREMEKQ